MQERIKCNAQRFPLSFLFFVYDFVMHKFSKIIKSEVTRNLTKKRGKLNLDFFTAL